jgi:hypothetical protein
MKIIRGRNYIFISASNVYLNIKLNFSIIEKIIRGRNYIFISAFNAGNIMKIDKKSLDKNF